jgi:hypothetical protein
MKPLDLEMEIIGAMIEACAKGRAAELDTGAWQRIGTYARSLCQQGERAAGKREAAAARAARQAQRAATEPATEFHILRRSRREATGSSLAGL